MGDASRETPNRFQLLSLKVFADLKTRGCQDILIAVTDGLKRMRPSPRSIRRRHSRRVSCTCFATVWTSRIGRNASHWRRRCGPSTRRRAPKPRVSPWTISSAVRGVGSFRRWSRRGVAHRSFRSSRSPPEVRRLIYTTNSLESVHAQLRTIIKTRGHFPNDDAARKLIWLALRNITAK